MSDLILFALVCRNLAIAAIVIFYFYPRRDKDELGRWKVKLNLKREQNARESWSVKILIRCGFIRFWCGCLTSCFDEEAEWSTPEKAISEANQIFGENNLQWKFK